MKVFYRAIGFCKETMNREGKRFYLNNMQQTEIRIQIINCERIQTHHRSFCTPKPDAGLCMHVNLKTAPGRRGPLGLRVVAGRRAVSGRGPLGRGPAFSKTQKPQGTHNLVE